RLELDANEICNLLGDSWNMYLSVDGVIRRLINNLQRQSALSYDEITKICNCFQFEMSDDFTVDLGNNKTTSSLALIKVIATIEDDELQKSMGHKGVDSLGEFKWRDA